MTAGHTCAASGCDEQVRLGMLMCRQHWFQLPYRLRSRVLRAWHDGDITPDYRDAVDDAVHYLEVHQGAAR